MRIAVLSGKGGTGKTLVSVNLAAVSEGSTYIDCDVEEPNGRLFFKPEKVTEKKVFKDFPVFKASMCKGCRKCVNFCRFNALVFIKDVPVVFPEVCHSCGGCSFVCPFGAVSEKKREVGIVEQSSENGVRVVSGILNPGEASGIPVLKEALKSVSRTGLTVIDCPPGSACSVTESAGRADYCLLVAEPTAFGFHNFKMVHKLVTMLDKPCGVVINKADTSYDVLREYCEEHEIPVLMEIPYDEKIAALAADGKIVSREDEKFADMFRELLEKIGGDS